MSFRDPKLNPEQTMVSRDGLITGAFPFIDEEKNEYKEKPKRVFVTDIENIHSTRAAEKNRIKKMWTSPEIKMEHDSQARDAQRKSRIEAAKKDPQLELSILEHYQSLVGEHRTVCDHGNNGFNTFRITEGGMRNVRVKSYPNKKYYPLDDNIQDFSGNNTKIIVDVGGSNIRELLAELKSAKNPTKHVQEALHLLRIEYQTIITKIRKHNPGARIILATPHYPFIDRINISEIYNQIKHLG
ncbi:MAG TPA: hypothetical protein VHM20_01080, partial [Gammaproteobacteria bacterium]|nr:hypothetical protein [Gammaproteobacteria bacterium]